MGVWGWLSARTSSPANMLPSLSLEQTANQRWRRIVVSRYIGLAFLAVGAAVANLEVETLKHSKPTFHGDTIYAETRVLEKKLTSKGDRGIVSVETKGINQRGEEVCYFKRKVMVWTAEKAPGRERPYGEDIWADAAD